MRWDGWFVDKCVVFLRFGGLGGGLGLRWVGF